MITLSQSVIQNKHESSELTTLLGHSVSVSQCLMVILKIAGLELTDITNTGGQVVRGVRIIISQSAPVCVKKVAKITNNETSEQDHGGVCPVTGRSPQGNSGQC